MEEKQLQALANELAKNLQTPEDLSQLDRLMKKISVEAGLKSLRHMQYKGITIPFPLCFNIPFADFVL